MKKRFLVVGLGHFGSWTARALHAQGHEVIAIDSDASVVDDHLNAVDKAVLGDATDKEVLQDIGADSVDAVIISTGESLAASVLATQALRELGLTEIYVKVDSPEAAKVMSKLGVADTVFPEREVAYRLAHSVTSNAVFDYLPLPGGYSLQQIAIPDAWLGKTLRELGLPQLHGINVVAVHDVLNDQLHPVPDPDVPLKESDLAIVVGRESVISDLLKSTAPSE